MIAPEQLTEAVSHLLERQLSNGKVAYFWPEAHRILFSTADGRNGDVEVLVNWDAVTEAI